MKLADLNNFMQDLTAKLQQMNQSELEAVIMKHKLTGAIEAVTYIIENTPAEESTSSEQASS